MVFTLMMRVRDFMMFHLIFTEKTNILKTLSLIR